MSRVARAITRSLPCAPVHNDCCGTTTAHATKAFGRNHDGRSQATLGQSHFLLPDLGEGLAEAELIDWKVKAGDVVKESQTIAEMQTDKALVEVPTPWAGTITELCGKAGDVIPVGAVLVRYAAKPPAPPPPA